MGIISELMASALRTHDMVVSHARLYDILKKALGPLSDQFDTALYNEAQEALAAADAAFPGKEG